MLAWPFQPLLPGGAQLQATGTVEADGALTGTGTLTGVGASTAAAVGSLSGTGALAGVGASTAASVGSLSGTGDLTGIAEDAGAAVTPEVRRGGGGGRRIITPEGRIIQTRDAREYSRVLTELIRREVPEAIEETVRPVTSKKAKSIGRTETVRTLRPEILAEIERTQKDLAATEAAKAIADARLFIARLNMEATAMLQEEETLITILALAA